MTNEPAAAPAASEIVVYWRPGCMFCSSLFRQLDKHGVAHRRVNIWDDAGAAAAVRTVANGNETVPTVAIGTVSVVNPDIRTVIALAGEHAPLALSGEDGTERTPFWRRPR